MRNLSANKLVVHTLILRPMLLMSSAFCSRPPSEVQIYHIAIPIP